VKINRNFRGEDKDITGFILAKSKKFILIQEAYDFRFDGYIVIPMDQFDSVRCNKFDRASKMIYKKEGLLGTQYGIQHPILLRSWQDLFTNLKKLDFHVIVECEDKEESLFSIGPIKRINKNSVSIQYYNPAGQLFKKFDLVNYDEITRIEFGDPYSTTFRKYLKPEK
jgi:hypothetical protein